MFDEIVSDAAKEISKALFLAYSDKHWLTHEEAEDLKEMAEKAARSKITDAFGGFRSMINP